MKQTGTNAAQLELGAEMEDGTFAGTPAALRAEVAERVAAHRARRTRVSTEATDTPHAAAKRNPQGRRAAIAGAIAERYAQAESYRSFLAAEAERSVREAEAVAEVATINARAIASAQQQLLADLEQWEMPADPRDPQITNAVQSGLVSAAAFSSAADVPAPLLSASVRPFTVRLPDEFTQPPLYSNGSVVRPHRDAPDEIDMEEASLLDDEIAFRHARADEQPQIDAVPLAANLIEFPRQLVATRKVRPRLAEGPLRDETGASEGQLRIFEAEPADVPATPAAETAPLAPEWSSILLAPQAESAFSAPEALAPVRAVVPQVAPVGRRVMAGLVDASVVLATLAAATAVFVRTTVFLSPSHAALQVKPVVAGLALASAAAALAVVYLLLFFTFSESTPGMRYARIALCSFSDENPSRAAMRRRLVSLFWGVLPLGLGIFWAFLDEDTLGWHDRLSRMYQRSY